MRRMIAKILGLQPLALPLAAQRAREVRVTIPHVRKQDINDIMSTFFFEGRRRRASAARSRSKEIGRSDIRSDQQERRRQLYPDRGVVMGIQAPAMRPDAPRDPGPRCSTKACPFPALPGTSTCFRCSHQGGYVRKSGLDRIRISANSNGAKKQRGARALRR
jgi:hypothetical protein